MKKGIFTAAFATWAVFATFADSGTLNTSKLSPMIAAPAPAKIAIDGDISEWNMNGSQVIYVSGELLPRENAEFALFHNSKKLYLVGRVADVSPLKNIHPPSGRFWEGDGIQFRLFTAKNSSAAPQRAGKKIPFDKRVVHCCFYRQSTTEKNWALFDYSFRYKSRATNPPGVETAFKINADGKGYAFEIAIPWSVLSMDWKPENGDFIRGDFEINFSNSTGDKRVRHANGMYNKNPGDFGFLGGSNWGELRFSESALKKRQWLSLKKIEDALVKTNAKKGGVPISVILKHKARVTVNVFDKNGKILREIVSRSPLSPGKRTIFWDGLDNTGKPVLSGKYRYEVAVYAPITAKYLGSVASSGNPPYANAKGTGAWGGDHSTPLAVSADKNGFTFLWPKAELGRAIVHLNRKGETVWRKTPFFDAAGNFHCLASDGEFIYLIHESFSSKPKLFRLSEKDGSPHFFRPGVKAIPLPVANFAKPACPPDKRPVSFDISVAGIAVDSRNLYVSIYPDDKILVLDKKTAATIGEIAVPGPRGLALNAQGEILVASYTKKTGARIYKISKRPLKAVELVRHNLSAPWGITVLEDGRVVVSDLGESQQVKVFSTKGKLLKTLGAKGGRALAGKYSSKSFLRPAGLAADEDGGFILAESAIPSVISRFDKTLEIEKQWFGPGCYAHAVWADDDNPYLIYSMVPGGMLRSVLNIKDKSWRPDAYWCLETPLRHIPPARQERMNCFKSFPQFAGFTQGISYPQIVTLKGVKFISSDSPAHPIARIDGDKLTPVAYCELRGNDIVLWNDSNGDGKPQKNEIAKLANLTATKGKTRMNAHVGSQTLSPFTGDWYLAGNERIYKIPMSSVKSGVPLFDSVKAAVFIDDVSGENHTPFHSSYRWGILGMRLDSKGYLYALYTYYWKTPGIGHSSDISRVFLAKFAPNGKCIWRRGRKAASFANPGEIYNPWVLAGVIDDKLVGISDEAGGMIHFYDSNGFYRGKIFADYARGEAAPGPYLFHGENFSGRVQYFPKLKAAFAYQGMTDSRAFALSGWRAPAKIAKGTVPLKTAVAIKKAPSKNTPAVIALVKKIPAEFTKKTFWAKISKSDIASDGKTTAEFSLAMDSDNLAFRFKVFDKTPLMNSSDSPNMAFKGGDAVDLYFGPYTKLKRRNPVFGDIRIIATELKGKPVMLAMRPISKLQKPFNYTNPGGYVKRFDYVGEIPGGKIAAEKITNGYVVTGMIPLKFFEPMNFLKDAKFAFDADVIASDAAGRRSIMRTFWHSSGDSRLTMTQDVPTECWLYPEFWGVAETVNSEQ